MKPRVPKCKHCAYFPEHQAQGYYIGMRKCAYRLAGYDCRRFIPTKHRNQQEDK